MKHVMFRRIGGKVVPLRVGKGVKLVDPIMATPKFAADQAKLAKAFVAQQNPWLTALCKVVKK